MTTTDSNYVNGQKTTCSRRTELKTIAYLALPVLIANVCNMGMGFVDTIVAGKASAVDMAGVAIGASLFNPLQLFAIGILMVIGPLIANYRGQSSGNRSGVVTYNGIWLALILGIGVIVLELLLIPMLRWISPELKMYEVAKGYLHAVLWGVPANLTFIALRGLNEGANMTRPAMLVGIASLLLNIPLNYMFAFGAMGMPALGGVGCGVATAVIYWFQAIAMFGIVYIHPVHRRYRRQIIALRRPNINLMERVLKVGFPVGISMFCEVLLFCGSSLVLAPLGAIEVGSHQIACNVSGMMFMLPLSIGLAASIRVAYHTGACDSIGLRSSIIFSFGFVLCTFVVTFLTVILLNKQIVSLFNDEPAIITTASVLIFLSAIYQLPDCIQVVSAGILRGFRDTAPISIITFISYWIIGFPIGVILSRTTWVTQEIMGARGVWIGFICGLISAAILLLVRMNRTYRREQAKIYSTSRKRASLYDA